ncbi:MAG: SH3 domain-containing protein [Enterobacterales bacterium]|nr:SH3 domain-containing protein [Enterobacterales bacterium]
MELFKRVFDRLGIILLLMVIGVSQLQADEEVYQKVTILEPFIEFHTGPGRGYPVFYVVERGQQVELIKKKTQWYKVRSVKGHEGWVHENTMEKTLAEDNSKFDSNNDAQKDFVSREWEAGVLAGNFGGATSLTLYGGWNFTKNLTSEFSISQVLGNVSDIRHADISLIHQAFPEWRYSPFINLGAGIIQTVPFSTLVQSQDRTDQMVHVGLGVKAYISRQFFIRAEYTSYTILTSRNDNDEVEEWKLGFSIFF